VAFGRLVLDRVFLWWWVFAKVRRHRCFGYSGLSAKVSSQLSRRRRCEVPLEGGRVWQGMDIHFFIEAKSFVLSVVACKPEFRFEERKDFSRVIFLGPRCIAWLVAMGEEVLRNSGIKEIKEFVKSTWEASKVLSVQRGRNRAGRFLEVAEKVVG
jgi:hypothetical protein